MYGKLDDEVLTGAENFEQRFKGTELEGLGSRLDTIVEMYHDKELSKDEAMDLIEDIRREQEVEALASTMELKADFLKAVDLLARVL